MTDITASPMHETPKTVSRSLFQLALIRFRRNRAAMAGCVSLGADCCIAASTPTWLLSPIFPRAVAASSCSGPSSFATSTTAGTAGITL